MSVQLAPLRLAAFARRINVRVLVLALILLIGAAALFSWGAVRIFDQSLGPALVGKAATVSDIVARQIGRAVRLGTPLDQIPGVEEFLGPVLGAHPEITYIAVADRDGRLLYGSGPRFGEARSLLADPATARRAQDSVTLGSFLDTAVSIPGRDGPIGSVHLGVSGSMVEHTLKEMVYDVAVVVVVSMLVTYEIVLILLSVTLVTPVRLMAELLARASRGDFRFVIQAPGHDELGRVVAALNGRVLGIGRAWRRLGARCQGLGPGPARALAALAARRRFSEDGGAHTLDHGDLASIRAPLFLFMFAEELSRSFFPLYVHDIAATVPGLSDKLVMGLPIALFMLVVTLFTPLAGTWADRHGVRRTLLIGMIPAVIGFFGTAAAHTLIELLVWRSCCAIGYAMMFIGAQGFIADHTRQRNRARGMATFVGAVVAAGVCGVSIGGILAEQIGFRATFLISAGLALLATLAVARLLPADRVASLTLRKVRLADYGVMLRNPRFLALISFSSIPTKMMLTGSLFYLTPVYLHELGESQSAIGRIMMGYGLIVVLAGPWLSALADSSGRHAAFAALGGLIAGAGALLVFQGQSPMIVLGTVITLGLGHALNNATQLALVPHVCAAECARIGRTTVFAIYRLIERAGSVAGPIVAAALADRYGYQQALGWLGAGALVGAVLFCAVFLLTTSHAVEEAEEFLA